jgi:LmbE family N-acetylglucosaminyl deacetylase
MMPSMGEAVEDVYLFVLAHPDDEIAVAPLLSRLAAQGKAVRLIYLTDGAARGASPATRRQETLAALRHIGIGPESASFPGSERGIPDGQLVRHLGAALEALEQWAAEWKSVAEIYSFAWEGGHPDHDASLVVAAAFAVRHGAEARVWQVPFYRASEFAPPPFFALGSLLPENGDVVRVQLTARERRLPAALIRFYRSQWRSFVGLGLAIAWQGLVQASLPMQRLDPARLRERPARKLLLYGKGGIVSADEFLAETAAFLDAHLPKDCGKNGAERHAEVA